jgi:anti-anti-sigma regulatory factor
VIEIREESASGSDPAVVIGCAGAGAADGVVRCVDLALSLGHSRLVVDLGSRADPDADLLGVLHRSARRIRDAGGRLGVVCGDSRLRRLLDLTLLSQAFHVYATREEALAG